MDRGLEETGDRNHQQASHLSGRRPQVLGTARQQPDHRGDDEAADSREDVVELAENLDPRRFQTDLLVGFAQRGLDDVRVPAFLLASGEGDLAFVGEHGVGAPGEQDLDPVGRRDQRHQDARAHQGRGRVNDPSIPVGERSAQPVEARLGLDRDQLYASNEIGMV